MLNTGRSMSFLAALALLAAVRVQDPADSKPLRLLSSAHYDLRHSTSDERAREILDYLEKFHDAALNLLQPDNAEAVAKKKATVIVYGNGIDYQASNPLPHAHGYYSESRIVTHDGTPTATLPVLAHEVMHHLTDITSINFHAQPSWFIEGIAECFANAEIRDGKFWFCVPTGAILMGRLPKVQQNMELGRWYPLVADETTMQDLRLLPRTDFYDDSSLAYAQAWSLCHFLMTFGDDGTQPIPKGRYAGNFMTYYKELRTGRVKGEEAWKKAFVDIDVQKLQDEWKEFVLSLDKGNALGVWGTEVSDEDRAKLKLTEINSAVRLTRVTESWPGFKAGLHEGDIVVRFDGSALYKGVAVSRLKDLADQTIGTRPILIAIRRGDKDLEITISDHK